jgi:hypothetical protein
VFADSVHAFAVSKTGVVQELRGNPLVTDVPDGRAPLTMRLEGVYPSPLTAGTDAAAVRFDLPSRSAVSLRIYTAQGKELLTVADAGMEAGRHVATFDPSALSSGVYFIVLRAGASMSARSFVVTR